MAEIDVQPKKKSGSLLPWLLLALGAIALLIFLFRNNSDDNRARDEVNNGETYNSTTENAAAASGWSAIDWNAPRANYEEITDSNIEVKGNESYGIYGLGEDILFDKDAATIRSSAEANLKQIAASISKRYNGGEVRVFGFTDATGTADHNQQLSEQRAEAVKNWLVQHGNLDAGRLSVQPQGEAGAKASNATEEGRQQNRRVEIVARRGE